MVILATVVHWLNHNSGAVQALLALALLTATAVYALYSVRLVSETREQRYSESQPHLLISLADDQSLDWQVPGVPSGGIAYPNQVSIVVVNGGRGAALRLRIMFAHPAVPYHPVIKDFLAPGDSLPVTLDAAPGRRALYGAELSWSETMERTAVGKFDGEAYDAGAIITCFDLYDRAWVSYLKLGLTEVSKSADSVSRGLVQEDLRMIRAHHA